MSDTTETTAAAADPDDVHASRVRDQIAPTARELIAQLPEDPDTATDEELARGIDVGVRACGAHRASLPTDPAAALTADPDHVMVWLMLGVDHLRVTLRARGNTTQP